MQSFSTVSLVLCALLLIGMCACSPHNAKRDNREDRSHYFFVSDTNYSRYQVPADFQRPSTWIEAEKRRWRYSDDYSDTMNLEVALRNIDSATLLWDVELASFWCMDHYQQAFPYLVARLSNKTWVGLKGTADLIIIDRIATGDLNSYGHGWIVDEDLFTVAGRASWILNDITGENFAIVRPATTLEELQEFKRQWVEYLHASK